MGQGSSKLAPKEIKELSAKTGYSREEIKQWYRGFLNDCPSGKLDRQEFKRVYANFFPCGDASEFAEHVFSTYDTNGDGSIDFREFLTAMSVTSRGTMEDKLKWAFELYDLNKDGAITKDEMIELIGAIYKMFNKTDPNQSSPSAGNNSDQKECPSAEERTNEIFDLMDKNADSKLSFEEFLEGARKDSTLLQFLEVSLLIHLQILMIDQ